MLCDYGCGQEATYQFKNGKWCCSKNCNSCKEIKRKNSISNSNRTPEENKKIGSYGMISNNKKTICKFCGKCFSITGIKSHEKWCYLNPDIKKDCPVCGKPIKNLKNKTCSYKCSNNFYSYKRKVIGTKKAKCIKCNKEFDIHLQRSSKKFICDSCNPVKKVHNPAKKINCKFCNRSIIIQNIKRHEQACKNNPNCKHIKYNYKRKDIRTGYIYKTTNLINQKLYIGKCKGMPEDSKKYLGSGIIITKAIQKYNKKNFKKVILEIIINDDLNERERYWIDYYNSFKGIGYNLTPGGDGGPLFQDHHHTEETKKLIGKHVSKK